MKRFETINVIPFIDIMLVMLAIVLTTASFIATGKIDIELPTSTHKTQSPEPAKIELAIDRQQQIYYNGQLIKLTALEQKISQLKPSDSLELRVDEIVLFARFVAVVDILKRHNINKMSIITQYHTTG